MGKDCDPHGRGECRASTGMHGATTLRDNEADTTAVDDRDIRQRGDTTKSGILDLLAIEVRRRIELLRPLCGPYLSVFAHAGNVLENSSTNGSAGVILYRGRPITPAARSFRVLANALACLAFRKGGVRYLGLHFDSRDPR